MAQTSARRLITPLTTPNRVEVSRLWGNTSIEGGRSMFQIGKLSTIVESAAKLLPANDTRRALLVGDLVLWRDCVEKGHAISLRVVDLLSQYIEQIEKAS